MPEFIEDNDISLVSVIIPQARLHHCLEQVLAHWPYDAIQFDCRGTMTREHWFQAFLPIMNPECEYLQFLVREADLNEFVQFCIHINDMHLPGAGAIFTSRCVYYSSNAQELDSEAEAEQNPNTSRPENNIGTTKLGVKNNLSAIFALIQSGRTDNAIKAAMQAGSHGPIVYFVEGRGIRDRVGWLRITKKPYEEVVMVLVEDIDRARIKDALVSAGRVNTLGGGIVFEIPIEQGLVNLPTSISNKSRLASNEQIIAAVDQLMGSTHWRDTRSLASLFDKHQSGNNAEEEGNVAVCSLIPRKYAEEFLDYLLSIGIPGANVIYTKLFSRHSEPNQHHELAQVRMVLPKDTCLDYCQRLQQFAREQEYKRVTFYQHAVQGVVRYQLKPKATHQTKGGVYRGASTSKG